MFKAGEEAPYRAEVSHYSPELELAALTIVDRDSREAKKAAGRSPKPGAGGRGSSAGRRAAAAAAATAAARSGQTVRAEVTSGAADEAAEEEDDEERFWAGVQLLQLGSLPRLQQDVQVGGPGRRHWDPVRRQRWEGACRRMREGVRRRPF